MKTKVSIDNLVINVGDQKIKLTLDQARELRDILNDTFPLGAPLTQPCPVVPIVIERHIPDPVYPSYPSYPHWSTPIVTCHKEYGVATLYLNAK